VVSISYFSVRKIIPVRTSPYLPSTTRRGIIPLWRFLSIFWKPSSEQRYHTPYLPRFDEMRGASKYTVFEKPNWPYNTRTSGKLVIATGRGLNNQSRVVDCRRLVRLRNRQYFEFPADDLFHFKRLRFQTFFSQVFYISHYWFAVD